MGKAEYPSEVVRQAIREEKIIATIAELRAEVAALKARPAMAWRRREDVAPEVGYRYLANETEFPTDLDIYTFWTEGLQREDGTNARISWDDLEWVIPWSDLMPPGGKDAS